MAKTPIERVDLIMHSPEAKKNIKVLTLVGTRPELIKLSRVIPLFDKYTDHTFVHTGQNYSEQLNAVFFEQMKISLPDVVLSVASDTPMKSVAQVLEQTD